MRYADIKKASKDERQDQTTTTNINYIKKFMSVLKTKLNNKVKIASDRTENKQKKLVIHQKKMVIHQFIIKLGNT